MKIGIASPIILRNFHEFLDLKKEHLQLGFGGSSVSTIIIGLLKLGHQVSVYTLDQSVKTPLILEGQNLKVYIGHYRPSGRSRMTSFFRKEINQIADFIKHDQPEIVNAHWTYEYSLAALKNKTPHLLTFRDDSFEIMKYFKDPYRAIRLFLDQLVRFKGKNFNVNSYYLQKKLTPFKKNIPVVPNPINEEEILTTSKEHPCNKIKIVSILTGWHRKNPEAALRAFHIIRNKYKEKVELFLIGNCYGPEQTAQQWARQYGLEEGVHFIGKISHQEVLHNLPDYDILLHPALEESFGNTLLEAMAKGLPVIAGEASGAVPWVLNFGKNGLLTNVSSPEAIAESLESLIQNPKLYEDLSSQGLKYVQNFSSIKIAEQYIKLYKDILNHTLHSQP